MRAMTIERRGGRTTQGHPNAAYTVPFGEGAEGISVALETGHAGYPAVRTTSTKRITTAFTAWYGTHASHTASSDSFGVEGRRS